MKIKDQHIFQSKTTPKQGCILLADPLLDEAFFQRAAILLIDHNDQESFGLVLNHPSEITLKDLFEHIDLDLPIFNGGPVAPQQLFYLHRFSHVKGALQVTPDLYFGGEWQQVLAQAMVLEAPHAQLRFFAGYSGWGPQQLSDEIADHAWICTEAFQAKDLLKTPPALLWKNCMLRQGPELAVFAHFPVNISDN
jgi:putative transcriptional regulator